MWRLAGWIFFLSCIIRHIIFKELALCLFQLSAKIDMTVHVRNHASQCSHNSWLSALAQLIS